MPTKSYTSIMKIIECTHSFTSYRSSNECSNIYVIQYTITELWGQKYSVPFSDQAICLNETMRCTFPSTISPCSCSLHSQTQLHSGHKTSMLHVHKSGYTARLCTEWQMFHLSTWGMHLHQMGTQEQTVLLSCTHHTEVPSYKSFQARTVQSQLTAPKGKGHEAAAQVDPPIVTDALKTPISTLILFSWVQSS